MLVAGEKPKGSNAESTPDLPGLVHFVHFFAAALRRRLFRLRRFKGIALGGSKDTRSAEITKEGRQLAFGAVFP